MMATVQDVYNFLNNRFPFEAQEPWDNSGIQTGDMQQEVNKIAVVLDVTPDALEKAVEFGAEVVVSHHPVLFRAVKSLTSGNIAFEAIKNGVSIISSHTAFDVANGGVSDILLDKIELTKIEAESGINPCLRVGKTDIADVNKFAAHVSEKLNAEIRFCGGRPVERVAVCGGSGCSLLGDVLTCGADTFVTGDAGHHDFLDFQAAGVNLIAAGHFETENIAMFKLAEYIQNEFEDCAVTVLNQESPVQYIHK